MNYSFETTKVTAAYSATYTHKNCVGKLAFGYLPKTIEPNLTSGYTSRSVGVDPKFYIDKGRFQS